MSKVIVVSRHLGITMEQVEEALAAKEELGFPLVPVSSSTLKEAEDKFFATKNIQKS